MIAVFAAGLVGVARMARAIGRREGIDWRDVLGGREPLARSAHAAAHRNEAPVVLRLSVAEVSRPGNAPRLLHDIFRLAPGEALVR